MNLYLTCLCETSTVLFIDCSPQLIVQSKFKLRARRPIRVECVAHSTDGLRTSVLSFNTGYMDRRENVNDQCRWLLCCRIDERLACKPYLDSFFLVETSLLPFFLLCCYMLGTKRGGCVSRAVWLSQAGSMCIMRHLQRVVHIKNISRCKNRK